MVRADHHDLFELRLQLLSAGSTTAIGTVGYPVVLVGHHETEFPDLHTILQKIVHEAVMTGGHKHLALAGEVDENVGPFLCPVVHCDEFDVFVVVLHSCAPLLNRLISPLLIILECSMGLLLCLGSVPLEINCNGGNEQDTSSAYYPVVKVRQQSGELPNIGIHHAVVDCSIASLD